MNVETIKLKPGKQWSPDEVEMVFREYCEPGNFERWVGLASTKTYDKNVAVEAVQRAFVKAVRGLASFDSACGRFDAWFGRIVLNEALGMMREDSRREKLSELARKETQATWFHNGEERFCAPINEMRSLISDDFAWKELEPVLSKLPDACREALYLCAREGLSLKDAAQKSGCKPSAMAVRLYRARDILRALMKGDGYGK